jgi:tRNA A-37 threonylcarbamoyl transferase component Bud32
MIPGNVFLPPFTSQQRGARQHWRRVLSLAALGIVVSVLLMGCQVDQQTLQRDPFMRDMMSLQNQVDQPHKMGQAFDVGNTRWKINAAHAALTLRLGSNIVKAHGKFVVIDFTFTNTTDQPQRPTADMLQIEDAQLTSYKGDAHTTALLAAWQKTPNFLTDTFQPNKASDCSIVFDLPVQTSGLTLEFQSFPTQDDSMGM